MKKIALVASILCCSVQAEEIASFGGVNFYVGGAVVGSLINSDFKMDYAVDSYSALSIANPGINQKENSIGRIGMELLAGVKKIFSNNWVFGGEFNYVFSRTKYSRNLREIDDREIDDIESGNDNISYINVRHGDEIALSLKLGKEFNGHKVYGILGATTKQVEIKYGLDGTNIWVGGEPFEVNPKKRVWGAVFGLGGSRKLSNKISYFLEYKYKLYNSAKKNIDCRALTSEAFRIDHDASDRNFKVKSDKHELSFGITFNF